MSDRPGWQRPAAGAAAVAVSVVVVVFRSRIGGDFWPLDRSVVGPNLLAAIVQSTVVFVAAVLLYPPLRRHAHSFIDSKLAALHDRHRAHHEHLQTLGASLADAHDSLAALHDKLDKLTEP